MKKRLLALMIDERTRPSRLTEECDLYIFSPQDFAKVPETADGKPVYLNLTPLAHAEDIEVLRRNIKRYPYKGLLINNPYGFSLCEEFGLERFIGPGLNTMNGGFAADYSNVVLSYEISEPEYRLMPSWQTVNYFLYAYGRVPLMTLKHCPVKVASKSTCAKCAYSEGAEYVDETGSRFPVQRYKMKNCFFRLLNSVPVNLLGRRNKIKPNLLLDITGADSETAEELFGALTAEDYTPARPFTAGLYFKSVK